LIENRIHEYDYKRAAEIVFDQIQQAVSTAIKERDIEWSTKLHEAYMSGFTEAIVWGLLRSVSYKRRCRRN